MLGSLLLVSHTLNALYIISRISVIPAGLGSQKNQRKSHTEFLKVLINFHLLILLKF